MYSKTNFSKQEIVGKRICDFRKTGVAAYDEGMVSFCITKQEGGHIQDIPQLTDVESMLGRNWCLLFLWWNILKPDRAFRLYKHSKNMILKYILFFFSMEKVKLKLIIPYVTSMKPLTLCLIYKHLPVVKGLKTTCSGLSLDFTHNFYIN